MENNEIMNIEEVVEVNDGLVEVKDSNNALVAVAIVGGVVLLGAIAYRFIIKPIKAKHKAKKEAEAEDENEAYDGEIIGA